MQAALYVREALPKNELPYSIQDHADQCGMENLRDGELLVMSLNITEQKARAIIEKHTLSGLLTLPITTLQKELGKHKARILLSSFELAKRAFQKGLGILPVISCPADTIPFLTNIKDEQREHFLCIYLNARNQVIQKETISVGSLSASIVHPREVFREAITHSSASVILAHNHPSSDVSPSKDDIELTRRLVKAGEIMGMEVLDHIVISASDFMSMKERGLM